MCVEVMDACQLVFAAFSEDSVLRKALVRWFVHLELTPGHLLTLLEVHKLQEMMGTAPGDVFGEVLRSVLLVPGAFPRMS